MLRILFNKTEADGGGGTEKKTSLSDAIEKSAGEVDKDFKPEGTEKKGEKDGEAEENKDGKRNERSEKTTDSDEEGEEETSDSGELEDDLDEQDQTAAKNLYKALKNPQTAQTALKMLVSAAGYDLAEVKTKEEKKEVTKTIKDIIKEKIGEKFPFLSDTLGDAIQEAIKTAIEAETKPVKDELRAERHERIVKDAIAAQDKVISEYVDIKPELLQEVLRIQREGEIAAGPRTSHEKLFRTCLIMAAENLKMPLIKKSPNSSTTETKETKKSSPLSNLREKGTAPGKEATKVTQVTSYKDAIDKAVEQIDASFAGKK